MRSRAASDMSGHASLYRRSPNDEAHVGDSFIHRSHSRSKSAWRSSAGAAVISNARVSIALAYHARDAERDQRTRARRNASTKSSIVGADASGSAYNMRDA